MMVVVRCISQQVRAFSWSAGQAPLERGKGDDKPSQAECSFRCDVCKRNAPQAGGRPEIGWAAIIPPIQKPSGRK